jgi:hypothetical protein
MRLAVIAVALGAAVALYVGFVRRGPEHTATAHVLAKTFKPAGSTIQMPAGASGAFRTPTRIPTAEGYILTLSVDGMGDTVGTYVNEVAARAFDVGQAVRIRYTYRGFPGATKRLTVLQVERQ